MNNYNRNLEEKLEEGKLGSINKRTTTSSFSKSPGLSYVICTKYGNSSVSQTPTFDCVICNQEKAVTFSLLEIAKHVQSLPHVLNVIMVENSLLYNQYKNENSHSTEMIIKEVLKHEENCQASQKVSFATEKTYLNIRSSVLNRIRQSLSTQNKKNPIDKKDKNVPSYFEKFKSTLVEIPSGSAEAIASDSENKFNDISASNTENETSLSKQDVFKFNVDKMLMGSKTSEEKYLQYKMLADVQANEPCETKVINIEHETSSNLESVNRKSTDDDMQLTMPALWDQKSMSYLRKQLETFSVVYASDIVRIKKLQKNRIQTNIVIVTDERDEYDINLANFNERVTVLKIPAINFKNVFSYIQKEANYGKGTLFVFSCGIHSVLTSYIMVDCVLSGCNTPQTMLTCAPSVDNYAIICDALKLNFDILQSTSNDIAIFSGLIPVDIETYNTFTMNSRLCRVTHSIFQLPVILQNAFQSYLTAVELFNGFTKYHAHNLGFTPWSIEDSFFDVNNGASECERGFLQSKMYVNGYILSSEENVFKANKAKLLCTELLSSLALKSETLAEPQSSKGSKSHQFDKVVVIADKKFTIWLQDFKKFDNVTILADEELSIYDFETYVKEKKQDLSAETLYLFVVGIDSITTSVNFSICERSKCSFPLKVLTPLCKTTELGVVKNFVKFLLEKMDDILNKIQSVLPHKSKVAILPPIPIAVLPSDNGHKALHRIKSLFPEYVIIYKISLLSNLYTLWMEEMSALSRKSIIKGLGIDEKITETLNNFQFGGYQDLIEMKCQHKFDKPSYVLWKHVVCDFLKAVGSSSKNIFNPKAIINIPFPDNKPDPVAFTNVPFPKNTPDLNAISNIPIPEEIKPKLKSNLKVKSKHQFSIPDKLKNLNSAYNCGPYDYLVFIGHMSSKVLLPKILSDCHLYWKFDDLDITSIIKKISILQKKGAKKILLIFIGDIPMILAEVKDQQCIKKNCKTQLSYFNILPSLITKMVETIDSFEKLIVNLKNHCELKFNCIVAPLLPRNCVHIPNLLYIQQFHKVIHDYKESFSYSNFFIGNSSEKTISHILLDFETKWKGLSQFVQKKIPTNPSEAEILSKFSKQFAIFMDHVFQWNALNIPPVGHIDNSSAALVKWQECLLLTSVNIVEIKHPNPKSSNISDSHSSLDSYDRVPVDSDDVAISNGNQSYPNIVLCHDKKDSHENYVNFNNVISCHNKSAEVVSKLLNDLELAKEGCKSYGEVDKLFSDVFIVGKKELVGPLAKLNVRASIVSHNLANIEESDINCVLYKMGKLTTSSLCCLVFDLTVIMKKLPISSDCCKHLCPKPLSIISFKNESSQSCDTLEKVETIINNQLQNINQFVKKLSKHVPVIILPLFPARIFGNNSSHITSHDLSHKICEMGFYVTNEDNFLWNQSMKALTFAWNSLLENNHENYDSYNCITTFISSEPNSFLFLKNIEDFEAKWNEVDLWTAFIETLLLSLIPAKFPEYGYSLKFKTDKEQKAIVNIKQISSSVPLEFFKELVLILDTNATFKKEEDKGILENIMKDKAKLVAAKLNNYLLGDSFLQASICDIDDCDLSKFTLVQQMYISSIFEILDKKWKPTIVKNLALKIYEVPDITNIKTLPCIGGVNCKGIKLCLKYHNSIDRRRNPLQYTYNARYCTKAKKNDVFGLCIEGITCGNSHNIYEMNFLPMKFQAQACPSLTSADICNSRGLCHYAHKNSAEMFYTSEFEDLLLFGAHNTLKYFTGAIKAVYKKNGYGICKARVIFMSTSSELINLVLEVSAYLIKAFNLKVFTLGKGKILLDHEHHEIFVGHPNEIFEVKPEILMNKTIGAILVDSVQNLLENDKQREKLKLFFQTINSSMNYKSFNKVFVGASKDSRLLESLLHTTGLPLKEIQEPVCNDLQKGNFLGSLSALNSTSQNRIEDVKHNKYWPVGSTSNYASSNLQDSSSTLELNLCPQTESISVSENQSERSRQDDSDHNLPSVSDGSYSDSKLRKKSSQFRLPNIEALIIIPESSRNLSSSSANYNKENSKLQSLDTSNISKLKSFEKAESISRKCGRNRSRSRDHKRSRSNSSDERSQSRVNKHRKTQSRSKNKYVHKHRKTRSRSKRKDEGSDSEVMKHVKSRSRSKGNDEGVNKYGETRLKSRDHTRSRSSSSEQKQISPKYLSWDALSESRSKDHIGRSRSRSKNSRDVEICGVSNSSLNLEFKNNLELSTTMPKKYNVGGCSDPKDKAISDSTCSKLHTQSKNNILWARLGQELYGQYLEELSSMQKQFDKEFMVYKGVPHLHPKYKNFYDTFTSFYASQHAGNDKNHEQSMWTLFWTSKFDDIKAKEWKGKCDILLKKYEDKAEVRNASLSDSSLTGVVKSFVYDDGLSVLEKLCGSIGMFGPGLKSIINECRVLGTTTFEGYKLFGNDENEVLINMVLEKCKQLSISATGESLHLFEKAIEYIPKLLDEAKLGIQQSNLPPSIDLNAIAKASMGKGSEFTYDLIKTVLEYEGVANATTEYINNLFLKVCKIHFSLSFK